MLTVAHREAPGKAEKPEGIVRGMASRQPWAWTGLCFAVPFHEASREGCRDVVNNLAASVFTGLAWTRDSQGNTAANLGTSAYLEWPDHPRHDRPTTAFTAIVRLKKLGSANADSGIFSNVHTVGASPWTTWSISQPGAETGIVATMSLSAPGDNFSATDHSSAIPTTEYVTMITRWRTGTAQTVDVFSERGIKLLTESGTTQTGPLEYGAGMPIRLNTGDTVADNYNAHYSQALVWSRWLSDVELAWLIADPFGWYSPRRETVVLAGAFPLIGWGGPAEIGTLGAIHMTAPVTASKVTEVTLDTSIDQGASLTLTVDGIPESHVVAANDTLTRPVDEATETVTEIGIEADPEPENIEPY